MAEVFFLTRGHIDHVEKFVRSMRNLWFPFQAVKKVKDENGKEFEMPVNSTIDGQLRPYQLWGYVCPEQFVEPLCNSLGIPTDETYFDQEAGSGGTSFISGKGVKFELEAMRLLLGAKKLPKPDEKDPRGKPILTQPIYKQFVNVLGIGYRPDEKGKTMSGEHELI